MKKAIVSFIGKYFGESLDLHVQSFNLLGFAGMAACAVVACISFAQNAIVNAAICFFFFCAAFCLAK